MVSFRFWGQQRKKLSYHKKKVEYGGVEVDLTDSMSRHLDDLTHTFMASLSDEEAKLVREKTTLSKLIAEVKYYMSNYRAHKAKLDTLVAKSNELEDLFSTISAKGAVGSSIDEDKKAAELSSEKSTLKKELLIVVHQLEDDEKELETRVKLIVKKIDLISHVNEETKTNLDALKQSIGTDVMDDFNAIKSELQTHSAAWTST